MTSERGITTPAPIGGETAGPGAAGRTRRSLGATNRLVRMVLHLPRRILPRRLFWRALLIIVMPLILVQAVAAFILLDKHWGVVSRRLADGIASNIAVVIEQMRWVPQAEHASRVFAPTYTVQQLLIAYEEGATIAAGPQSRAGPIDQPLTQALSERVRRPFAIDTTSLPRDVRIQIQLPEGVLDVKVPRQLLFTSTTYLVVLWMVGTAVILVVIALLFMANQIRPIRRLAEAAERFGKGQEVEEFKPSGATEVRQAAAAFLAMQERIRRQIEQRTALLAGVSHDLRTPLTRMKLQLALLKPSPEIEDLERDIGDMERMVEAYLAFARGEGTEKPQHAGLDRILADVTAAATRDGRAVSLDGNPPLVLLLRPQAIKRCFTNLVDNALRFASQVRVRAARRGNAVEITVDDDGPGIPPERREDVFKPFFRLEESRNRATGGVGLGLTIARDIARGHGGDVTLGASPLGGLRATVRLPL